MTQSHPCRVPLQAGRLGRPRTSVLTWRAYLEETFLSDATAATIKLTRLGWISTAVVTWPWRVLGCHVARMLGA
jgi:hypothetical protein